MDVRSGLIYQKRVRFPKTIRTLPCSGLTITVTFVSPSPSCEPVPLVPSSSISPSAIIPDNEGHTSPSQLSHGSLVDNAYSPTSTLAHDTPFESHGRERERGSENENVLSLSLIRHYREGAGQW